MKPRHRATLRLARRSPGARTLEVRPLVDRLEVRQKRGEPAIVLPIPWKDLVYDHRPVPIKRIRLADPSPNAPLLKRVVRHPYAMEPLGSKRIDLIAPEVHAIRAGRAAGDHGRESIEIVFAASRDARDRPVMQAPELPARRPSPFARQREVQDELRATPWIAAATSASSTGEVR